MTALQRPVSTMLGMALALTLGGCGGGGDSGPAPAQAPAQPPPSASTSAEGLYSGSMNTNRTVLAVVLDDGTYYFFYSVPANPNLIAGVIQGNGTSTNGTFTSVNTKDFNAEGFGVLDPTISASYAARQSLGGSLTYPGTSVTFTSVFNPAYDLAPSLASLAGTYTGQAGSAGGVQPATVTITSTGGFTGVEADGCVITGTATPRVRGNLFDFSATFGAAPCEFIGTTFVGHAYLDVTTRRLYAAAPASNRTNAVIFSGTKP